MRGDLQERKRWIFTLSHMVIELIIEMGVTVIPGETDQTDKKLETAEVKRRSSADPELDLPNERLGKMIILSF